MFLGLGKKRTVDHFIPGDGISIQWFEENFARYIGPGIEWTYCTHMENGKEGFLCKAYEPISPDIILCMRLDCHETKQRLKNQAQRAYFERLKDTWREGEGQQHEESRQQHQTRARQQAENWRNDGDPGLNIPALRLQPSYNSTQNNSSRDDSSRSGLVWNAERGYWGHEQDYTTNNTRYTRSTPVTPISPLTGGHWGNLPDRGTGLTPVSPLSHHRSNSSYLDQYQQRSSGVIARHDRSTGLQRPHSAVDMRQSSTGQILLNISRGSYSWI